VPALALLIVGLVGLALALRVPGQRRRKPDLRRPWRSPLMRSLAATLVVTLACWSAPLVDQVTHTPGNLGLLATAATLLLCLCFSLGFSLGLGFRFGFCFRFRLGFRFGLPRRLPAVAALPALFAFTLVGELLQVGASLLEPVLCRLLEAW